MKRKAISFVLIIGVIAGIFSSCTGNNNKEDTTLNLEVTLGGTVFKAETLNSEISKEEIAVYTRDYKDSDGNILLTIGGSHSDRAVFGVKYSKDENGTEFLIVSANTSGNSKADTIIPVNGFVISIPLKKVEGLRIKEDQEISVNGFETIAAEYERFDLGTFIPEKKILTRRVSYINPVNGVTDQPCITLLTANYNRDTVLPDGAVAFIMRLVASDNYRISSIQNGGTITGGTNALIFVGNYNALYAKTFFTEDDKLYISRKERISEYSDVSAIVVGETVYKIGEEKTNSAAISESGIYFFNSYYKKLVTPERTLDFYDVVIVDNIVVYKGEKNKRIIIPSNAGVVVSFVGERISIAEGLKLGDYVPAIIVKSRTLPEKYVAISKYIFEISSLNTVRTAENSCVLYTRDFGETTGTDNLGTEIIISGDKVVSVGLAKGNSVIPEDGYVLSIQRTSTLYKYADHIEEDMESLVSLAGSVYSMVSLNYNEINALRSTDMLVVYKNVANTATNSYGYEIIVNSDGKITGDSVSGNSQVPSGGFVLSGHGTSEKALRAAFKTGADVVLNESDKKVTIFQTPMLNIQNALNLYESSVTQFKEAQSSFYDINYESVGKSLDEIAVQTVQINKAVEASDFSTAIHLSVTISDKLEKLQYSMIRSSAVENRAAWYRSVEKDDASVIATIQKAVSLNINTIYLETWYNGMIIGYSDNKLIAHNTVANGNFDALEAFCRIGHEYGIEIHAWVENFFIGTLSEAETNSNALINNTYGKHLLDSQGNNYCRTEFGDFVFLNPYDQSNRKLVLDLYEELMTKYDIDGIHLDYIRFPEYNFQTYDYGYNADIIAGFQREYNTTIDPRTLITDTEMHDNWCKFREEIINSWVEQVYKLVMAKKPDLWISCACYPQANVVPKTIFQNVRNWVANGWIDEVFSMSYGTDNTYVYENAQLFESIVTDKAFYSTGISAFGSTSKLNFARQLDIVRSAGADGSAIFSLGSINASTYQNAMLNGPYAVKATQTYRLSETISAGMNDILRKLDKVYGYNGNHKFDDKIKPLISAMIQKADSFNLKDASTAQKIAYTDSVISELGRVITEINSVSSANDDQNLKTALTKEFDRYIEYMTQSRNRLKARLS